MTNQEIIDVLSAHAAGKTIQICLYTGWVDITYAPRNFENDHYQVKPEPYTFWLLRYPTGWGYTQHPTEAEARACIGNSLAYPVKFTEVT